MSGAATFNTADLDAYVRPRVVAVIGASDSNPRSFGSLALRNLLNHGYAGELHVVHRSSSSVQGIPAVASVRDCSPAPDLCVIAVPADQVPDVVAECVAAGARAISVVGSGFAESGTADGIELQRRLIDLARPAGVRILGPNTIGAAGFTANTFAAATANIPEDIRRGSVAVVSQSGGLGTTILSTAQRYGLGLATFIALGNEADVSAADAIASAVEQQASVVLCYLESLRNPTAFAEAAGLARDRGVPILLLKGGAEPAGQAIASSHTASLAGSMRVMDAVLTDLGVTRVSSIESLICAGVLFSAFGRPPGARCGVLGIGGGNSALLADGLEAAGVSLARLAPGTSEQLKASLPDSNGANPFDPGGWFLGKHAHLLEPAIRCLADDPGVDVMIYGLVPLAPMREEVYVRAIAAASDGLAKPAVAVTMHTPTTSLRKKAYTDAGIIELPCLPAALEAISAWSRHAAQPSDPRPPRPTQDGHGTRQGRVLLEDEAIEYLAPYGLRFQDAAVANTDSEAQLVAAELGFPLVVKAIAPGLHHRAQAGAVALNVTESTLLDALARVRRNASRALGGRTDIRLLLQRQDKPGTEMIVGVQRDPVFGAVVIVGLGGVMSELLDDVTFAVPPLNPDQAGRMLSRLRGVEYLHRLRAAGEFDEQSLIDVLVAIGRVASAPDSQLESLDLNPVIVNGSGSFLVDALAVLCEPQ